MAKFCGNCGNQLDDTMKVCGNCGTPVEGVAAAEAASETPVAPEAPVATEAPVAPEAPVVPVAPATPVATSTEGNDKIKKYVKLGGIAVVALIVLIIIVNIVSSFTGYKGAVRKIMKAYKKADESIVMDMASSIYDDKLLSEFFEFAVESEIKSTLDMFDDELGYDYKLNYEIIKVQNVPERKIEDLIEDVYGSVYGEEDEDFIDIDKMKVVKVELTAKDGNDTYTVIKEYHLAKEDGEWRLFSFE